MPVKGGLCIAAILLIAGSCYEEGAEAAGIEGMVTLASDRLEVSGHEDWQLSPYSATILIRKADTNQVVAEAKSGTNGIFRVFLTPGEYLVEPQSPGPFIPPYAPPQTVTVKQGSFARVEIEYDSGIR